jgi:subtilisin family serine protease
MKLIRLIKPVTVALLLATVFLWLSAQDAIVNAQSEAEKVEPLLIDNFTTEGSADFIIRFTEQADLSDAYGMDWNSRGEFVYNTLRETADKSQANAKAILDKAGLKYQTLIGGNDLYVWSGTPALTEKLAALGEVYYIRATRTYSIDPVEFIDPNQSISWAGDYLAKHLLTTVNAETDATTDWGISDTKANQAWGLGARGAGMKVANIDTGVQWDHPALVGQFACVSGSDPDCWADPNNVCGGTACDNSGHGTHTMGTMVAKDNPALPYIAGMAPDATWIACKGCETSNCSSYALTSCADWILAPGSHPANRPNVGTPGTKLMSTVGEPQGYFRRFQQVTRVQPVARQVHQATTRHPSPVQLMPATARLPAFPAVDLVLWVTPHTQSRISQPRE